jgi:hypothetical protein
MEIQRTASAQVGGRNSFFSSAAGVEPGFVFVRPPKPFSGTATFTGVDPATSTWTGSLSAWLPGLGPVRFAGRRFSSSLCRRASDERGCPRMPTVQRP